MKKIIAGIIIVFIISCQKELHTPEGSDLNSIFNASVGKPISTSVGRRWIERFNRGFEGGRLGQAYAVTKPNLEAMMQSTSGLIGFTFHHALDNAGIHHILVIPVDNSLGLWTSPSQRVLIDTNTDTGIEFDEARKWIDNYTNAYPNAIRYHFFGSDIFQEIVQSPQFQIEEAINDEQVPQLLLIVQNNAENSDNGRTNLEEQVYDASARCPTHCLDQEEKLN